jgi:deoxyribodipyrimidine photo-lyase
MGVHVVWFKRDLRLQDHLALSQAARQGRVLCLYIIEPSLWAQPDASAAHYTFLLESLRELDRELRLLGTRLHIFTGEALPVLGRLHAQLRFEALHAHEETGNAHTYARDLAVGRWCRDEGVAWREYPQFGVVRRLRSRDEWHKRWEEQMSAPIEHLPDICWADSPWAATRPPSLTSLPIVDRWVPPNRQRGGRQNALAVLDSFLHERCASYRGGISSPLSAPNACSRLSPHLAFGTLGLREAVQATRARLAALEPAATRQRQGLTAFLGRQHWHCHFIQKLESEPELEHRNLHRGYDGLREHEWNPKHFEALTLGRTGWPMVDACVAMLRDTGWLNFRMRAMLVSVAAYPLWLHWREVGLWLARQFVDYEPGIHWSQMQMQSGTTGINTTRVYNPVKQAQDHDPQGHFVRRWLPAMRRVPDAWLFEPWRMPADLQARCGVRVGDDIPMPIVDLALATRQAKARLHGLRAQPEVRAAKAAIVEKHGSRRLPANARRASGAGAGPRQLSLDL